MHPSAWTLYGREGCDCCATAAGLLLALVRGLPVTIRMVDVPRHGPRPGPESIPALCDPRGSVVWEGSFDSEATRMALEAWGVIRMHAAHDDAVAAQG